MNEVSILGLGASGRAAARLVLHKGNQAYVSEALRNSSTSARGDELRSLGADVELGGHDLDRIARSHTVVVSPGISHDAPVLVELRRREVRWISEPELAFRFLRGPLIAVTGTNGKTTTCALTAHLLRGGGASVGLGGNIGAGLGPPASELALLDPPPDWYVLEMSSFQLADVETFRPDIGVVTNLAPDHLDRYESVEAYYADKARLFENGDDASVWVLNADDPATDELAGDAPGRRFHVSLERSDVSGAVLSGDRLELNTAGRPEAILPVDELPLLGRHNVANALTAALTAHLAGTPTGTLGSSLSAFEGLPHRLAPVARVAGVQWVDDSKATNVAAAVSAVRSLSDRPLVVLLGGKDKGEPFGPLAEPLRTGARHVIVYGEAAGRLARELGASVPVEHSRGGFDEVVARARELAREGDTVLLAPACSSFDMFANYEERGRRFAELARMGGSGGRT